MMIALRSNETVFSVLGAAARRRAVPGLIAQFAISVVVAITILLVAPHWWSIAFLAGWSAAYAAWGLLVHVAESRADRPRTMRAMLTAVAALGTVMAISGIIGVGLAIYSGNARGVKQACGKGATSKYCQAMTNPAPTNRPLP